MPNPQSSRAAAYIKRARAAGATDEQIREELMHDPILGDAAKLSKEAGVVAGDFVDRSLGRDPGKNTRNFTGDLSTAITSGGRNLWQTARSAVGADTEEEAAANRAQIPESPQSLGGSIGRGVVKTGQIGAGILAGEGAGAVAGKLIPAVFSRTAPAAAGIVPKIRGLVATAPRAALEGGAATAASLPEANTPEDFWKTAGLGAGLGPVFNVAGRGAAATVDPTRRLAPRDAAKFALLKQEGIPVGASQITGGPISGAVSRVSESHPVVNWFLGGKAGQQDAINRAWLRRMGATEDEIAAGKLTPDILGSIDKRLGERFDLRDVGPKPFSQEFGAALKDIRARNTEAFKSVPTNPAAPYLSKLESLVPPPPQPAPALGGVPSVRQSIEEAIKQPPTKGALNAGPQVPAEPDLVHLGDARRQYAGLARDARKTGDAQSAETFSAIRDSIDKEIDTHLGSAGVTAPNREYSILKTMEKPGVLSPEGDVVPGPFMRATKQGGAAHQFHTNPTPDQELAYATNSLVDRTPNSGTVPRAIEAALVSGGAGAMFGHDPNNMTKDLAYGAVPLMLAGLLLRSPTLATGGQAIRRPISNVVEKALSPSVMSPTAIHFPWLFGGGDDNSQ